MARVIDREGRYTHRILPTKGGHYPSRVVAVDCDGDGAGSRGAGGVAADAAADGEELDAVAGCDYRRRAIPGRLFSNLSTLPRALSAAVRFPGRDSPLYWQAAARCPNVVARLIPGSLQYP